MNRISRSSSTDTTGRPFRSERGMALLITITLLAFLVLLVLGLAYLTRVETASSGNAVAAARARQNALTALNLALGRLQEVAGPDRRATFQGQRLTTLPHPAPGADNYWTGVVDAAAPTTVTWLVSNTAAPGAIDVNRVNNVPLVSTMTAGGGTDRAVPIAWQPLNATGVPGFAPTAPQTIGRYAWWVGEEASKADVAINDQVDAITLGTSASDTNARARVRQLVAFRSGTEGVRAVTLNAQPPENATWSPWWAALPKVTTFNQLGFGVPSPATPTSFRSGYHDLTALSLGVLEAATTGGLRRNLSADLPVANDLTPAIRTVRSALESLPASSGTLTVGVPPAPPSNPAEPEYIVAPLVTEWAVDFVPYSTGEPPDSGNNTGAQPYLYFAYRVRLELWNPYNVPLNVGTPVVKVGGFGRVRFSISGPQASWSASLDLATVFAPTDVVALTYPASRIIPAGSSLVVTGSVVRKSPSPLVPITDNTSSNSDNPLNFSLDACTLTLDLYPSASAVTDAQRLWRLSGVSFPAGSRSNLAWSITTSAFSGTFGSAATPTSDSRLSQRGFRFHARINDSSDGGPIDSASEWLGLAPEPIASGATAGYVDRRGRTSAWNSSDWVLAGDPGAAATDANLFNGADLIGRATGATNAPAVALRAFFDAPVQSNLSLGIFSSVDYPRQLPFAVGNPWGGTLNEIFDRAFFSPVSSSWTAASPTTGARQPLTNPRYWPVLDATGAWPTAAQMNASDAASRLLVRGMFNVNSASVAAWEALLSRTIPSWRNDGAGGASVALTNPIFLLPQTAHYATTAAPARRSLSATQVSALATAIVTRSRAQAPFTSLRDFVNSGVLARALSDVGLRTTVDADRYNTGPLPTAPTPDLPQHVLLAAIAPYLAVRSDTFTIRAAGADVNPATDANQAFAWCEAVVQRYPDHVTMAGAPSDPMQATAANTLGRRFRILSFRWLTPADL